MGGIVRLSCSGHLGTNALAVHGWNYRRYVTRHHEGSSNVSENEFALQKIQENFSNYSAWHQRSKLLPRMYERGSSEYLEAISRGECCGAQCNYTVHVLMSVRQSWM